MGMQSPSIPFFLPWREADSDIYLTVSRPGCHPCGEFPIDGCHQSRFLTQTQAKRLAVSAIKVCREFQDRNGVARKNRGTPIDRQLQDSGIVAMFQRGEVVGLGPERKPMMVLSVSRAKGTLVVAPQDNLDATEQVEPSELIKDPLSGSWPEELGGG